MGADRIAKKGQEAGNTERRAVENISFVAIQDETKSRRAEMARLLDVLKGMQKRKSRCGGHFP